MGFLDWLGDAAKTVVHGVEQAGETVVHGVENAAEWVGDRASDVEHWFGDLFSGNLGTQAMSVPEVVEKVRASQGATEWHGSASLATELANDHHNVAQQIQDISNDLESVWSGRGAEAAQGKLKPMADVADSAAQTFNSNSTNVANIASGFDELKRELTPLPSLPPNKSFWDVVTPWDTDTEDQINQYNAQIQENLNRYNSYVQQTQDSGQRLSIDYGQIGTFDGKVSLTSNSHTNTTSHQSVGTISPPSTFSRLDIPSSTMAQSANPAPTVGPGNVSGPGYSVGLPGQNGTGPSAYPPAVPPPTGYNPPGFGAPGNGPSRTPDRGASFGGFGFGPVGGFGGAGGGAGSARFGRAGGMGSGVGGGVGDRVAGGNQPGNRTGIGPSSRPGAAAAADRAAGSAGRGTTSGLGTAGAGAGRGKGSEDEEHSRRYGVEDDSLFVDHGERLIDPETGMHVTPPTIGG